MNLVQFLRAIRPWGVPHGWKSDADPGEGKRGTRGESSISGGGCIHAIWGTHLGCPFGVPIWQGNTGEQRAPYVFCRMIFARLRRKNAFYSVVLLVHCGSNVFHRNPQNPKGSCVFDGASGPPSFSLLGTWLQENIVRKNHGGGKLTSNDYQTLTRAPPQHCPAGRTSHDRTHL